MDEVIDFKHQARVQATFFNLPEVFWHVRTYEEEMIPVDTALDLISKILMAAPDKKVTEDTSDGFHTFKELYEYRLLYNAALFNEWAMLDGNPFKVHKSVMHHDETFCFDGTWFIVMAQLRTGQISNHYKISDWPLFHCEVKHKADVWDGHTSTDVTKRLREFLSQ